MARHSCVPMVMHCLSVFLSKLSLRIKCERGYEAEVKWLLLTMLWTWSDLGPRIPHARRSLELQSVLNLDPPILSFPCLAFYAVN